MDFTNQTEENATLSITSTSQNDSTTSAPLFVPCDNPRDLLPPFIAEVVDIVVFVGILPVLVTCGVIGNVINMIVFARLGLSDRINLCLFSLALADIGFLLFLMCGKSYALVALVDDKAGNFWEQEYNDRVLGSYLAFIVLSNVITAIIALERCVCVVSPFKAKKFLKTSYLGAVIFLIGLYALVVKNVALSLKYNTEYVTDPVTNTSTYVARLTSFYLSHKTVIDLIYSDLLSVTLPATSLVVVIVSTVVTVVKLRISMQWRHQHQSLKTVKVSVTSSSLSSNVTRDLSVTSSEYPNSNTSTSRSQSSSSLMTSAEKQEAAVTRMLVSVCCVYVICMTPSVTRTFALHRIPGFLISGYLCNTFKVTTAWVHFFEAANASFNVFIYYKQSSRYREVFTRLMHACRTCRTEGQAHGNSRSRSLNHNLNSLSLNHSVTDGNSRSLNYNMNPLSLNHSVTDGNSRSLNHNMNPLSLNHSVTDGNSRSLNHNMNRLSLNHSVTDGNSRSIPANGDSQSLRNHPGQQEHRALRRTDSSNMTVMSLSNL